jgi:hypothetical protein
MDLYLHHLHSGSSQDYVGGKTSEAIIRFRSESTARYSCR